MKYILVTLLLCQMSYAENKQDNFVEDLKAASEAYDKLQEVKRKILYLEIEEYKLQSKFDELYKKVCPQLASGCLEPIK